MGTKKAVPFANIFMAALETEIINRSHFKPLTWKRYIDDVFSLWNINKEEINSFIELANSYHPTIKFTVSDKEITFLDTCVYKVERSSKATFEENITQFKRRLRDRGYPDNLIENTLSEIIFSERMSALQNKQKARKRILPFVTEYRPSVPCLKNILMSKWHLIENQPLLREIYKDPPLLSYRKGRSLENVLVRAKL